MTKLLLSASIAFFMAGTTYAAQATCEITKETHSTKSSATVDANFNEVTTATLSNGKTQDFKLTTVKVNPDSSIEEIEIDGYTFFQCDHDYLYAADTGGNNGVSAICMDKKAIVSVSCIYND